VFLSRGSLANNEKLGQIAHSGKYITGLSVV